MLKITPYLGIIIVLVSIGGIWYPKLGYVVALVFLSILIISPFRSRWFCGNLCPRGSFNDFRIGRISRNVPIPKFFRSMLLRVPVAAASLTYIICHFTCIRSSEIKPKTRIYDQPLSFRIG
jgi:ferredoxin-type protein NapH